MARAKRIDGKFEVLEIVVVGLVLCGLASSAAADVDFYLAPQLGISGLFADTEGTAAGVGSFKGDDTDASPLIGLAVGLEMPMNEIVPREWLADARLPSWPVSFELEATSVRDYDFQTDGGGAGADVYTSEIFATTLLANTWTDIPLVTMWRPFQYVFGLGRQPRARRWLEPGSFYFGGGIGFTYLDIEGTDNTFDGDDDIYDFAWNVGAGFKYRVTERVSVSTGYRYLGLGANTGNQTVDLNGGVGANDEFEYDLQVHEFRVAIHVKIFSFRGAWR